jgi:hypothetical protein
MFNQPKVGSLLIIMNADNVQIVDLRKLKNVAHGKRLLANVNIKEFFIGDVTLLNLVIN